MKTPEEVKESLAACFEKKSCAECHYNPDFCASNCLFDMCMDAKACIEQLEERIAKRDDYIQKLEDNQLKWISIQERLPQDGQKVVMINEKSTSITLQGIYKAGKTPDTIRALGFDIGKVTHWMQMPEPPERKVGAHENP